MYAKGFSKFVNAARFSGEKNYYSISRLNDQEKGKRSEGEGREKEMGMKVASKNK